MDEFTKCPRCGYRSPVASEEELIMLNQGEEAESVVTIDFGQAIRFLKRGMKVGRKGWNGKNMWLALQVPDSGSKMSLPYIYMFTADGNLVPWLASQTDMLSNDWEVVYA